MSDRFHLSFRVSDLARSREFYTTVLQCRVERERDTWLDLDFFGHQVTIHQSKKGSVEGSERIMDHFGIVMARAEWARLRNDLENQSIQYRVPPSLGSERGKFVIADPDGVGLEFKYDERR